MYHAQRGLARLVHDVCAKDGGKVLSTFECELVSVGVDFFLAAEPFAELQGL